MPSLVNGLYSARSGINSTGTAIGVIGDNISNAETTGYKTQRADFDDLVAGGQGSGVVVGAGSRVATVQSLNEQGTLNNTGNALDLAVDGNGYFIVSSGQGQNYTRDGSFKTDSAGFITTQTGQAVLGYGPSGTGALQPLNTNTVSQDSVQTGTALVAGNLDAGSTTIPVAQIPTAPNTATPTTSYSDLNNAAQFQTVVNVYDTLGAKHTVTLEFYNKSTAGTPNTWEAHAYVNADEVNAGATGANAGKPIEIGTGATLSFGADGKLTTASANSITAAIPWANGSTSGQSVKFDLSNFTQFSASSNVLSISQDGRGVGSVTSVSIGKNGQVQALLDNGETSTIGYVALANFAAPEGLTRIGNNTLAQSATSGEPVIGKAEAGTFGEIDSGALELSTTDIANEFVNLITVQRGFQANTQIITTINQLLNDIIQLA